MHSENYQTFFLISQKLLETQHTISYREKRNFDMYLIVYKLIQNSIYMQN